MTDRKKRLLQINITANWGSHGKIAESIGQIAINNGWESYMAYGRWMNPSRSNLYHIGSNRDERIHGLASRLLDNHGLMSKQATRRLLQYIDTVHPDIVHLHNIHGYYLNYPMLFEYLKQTAVPTVWTLHDCWAFTGHCAHYMYIHCEKWKTHCENCPNLHTYPRSWLVDRSYQNFEDKKRAFLSVNNLTLVTVSHWLEKQVGQSFLRNVNSLTIHNGIDTSVFCPQADSTAIRQKYGIPHAQNIILGVASNWYHKGLPDFLKLRTLLDDSYTIVLVGLNKSELKALPAGITGIPRTQNVTELVALYSTAMVYFNPTWEDNYPTTNLEAIACGTPLITYDTGGSPEAVNDNTGFVIPQGNVEQAAMLIRQIKERGKAQFTASCRARAEQYFRGEDCFNAYFKLYERLVNP